MKKKIIIGIVVLVVITILIFVIILMPSFKNNKYNEKIYNNVKENTNLKNITYVNRNNNYYIAKSNEKVVVFDLNYEVVFEKQSVRESDMPLVYKRNNLYYVEKIRKKNKIIYNYYSTDEDILVFSSVVGGY